MAPAAIASAWRVRCLRNAPCRLRASTSRLGLTNGGGDRIIGGEPLGGLPSASYRGLSWSAVVRGDQSTLLRLL